MHLRQLAGSTFGGRCGLLQGLGTLRHPSTLAYPPSHRTPTAECSEASHTRLAWPATPGAFGLCVAGHTCGPRAVATTAAAATPLQPIASPSACGPWAAHRAYPPTTPSALGCTSQRAACGLCPPPALCPTTHTLPRTLQALHARLATGGPWLVTAGASSRRNPTDARAGRSLPGAAARRCQAHG